MRKFETFSCAQPSELESRKRWISIYVNGEKSARVHPAPLGMNGRLRPLKIPICLSFRSGPFSSGSCSQRRQKSANPQARSCVVPAHKRPTGNRFDQIVMAQPVGGVYTTFISKLKKLASSVPRKLKRFVSAPFFSFLTCTMGFLFSIFWQFWERLKEAFTFRPMGNAQRRYRRGPPRNRHSTGVFPRRPLGFRRA
jgi:hypothetical protein